jgi:hypothetical protein
LSLKIGQKSPENVITTLTAQQRVFKKKLKYDKKSDSVDRILTRQKAQKTGEI